MLVEIVRSLGVGRLWNGVLWMLGVQLGVVVFWNNRVLKLVGMEVCVFWIFCHLKNCEDDIIWIFIGVYGPIVGREREGLWANLGVIKALSNDP